MTHFYTIAQALIMFPGFMNAASLTTARKMWESLRGTPPKKVKLIKKGKRMDFRQSKCHSSNRTYRDGLNYTRRLHKLPKLSVGVAVCLNKECGHKTLMTASKRNHRFFCGDCKRKFDIGFASTHTLVDN
jgi:hypothetical protein